MHIIAPRVALNKRDTSKVMIYVLTFFFTLHITPATYINSSFLEQFVGAEAVGYIYIVASLLTILGFTKIRDYLKKYGNYKVFISLISVEILTLLLMASSLFVPVNVFWISIFIISYIIGFACRSLCFLNLDIFLEHFSSDQDTGGIRGFFLTSLNFALIIGPFIAGMILTSVIDAGKVYLLGAVLALIVLYIAKRYFSTFHDVTYVRSRIIETAVVMLKNKDLAKVFSAGMILRFFYAWMIIYTPIYLQQIGFTLSQVGIMIAIALIPFVVLQIPLGKIADKKLGEKEIMTAGFIITGTFTALMAFFDLQSFAFWAGLLLMTRVGASMIELSTETYLFKKIDDKSINIISFFRTARPIAYVISPIIASILLFYIEINYLFLILGLICIFGVRYSLTLKDTL